MPAISIGISCSILKPIILRVIKELHRERREKNYQIHKRTSALFDFPFAYIHQSGFFHRKDNYFITLAKHQNQLLCKIIVQKLSACTQTSPTMKNPNEDRRNLKDLVPLLMYRPHLLFTPPTPYKICVRGI
jgi:hypothetical protein